MQKDSNLVTLVALGTIWSTFAVFTKNSSELSPFFVAFSRLAIGTLLMCSFCFLKRQKVFVVKNFKNYAISGALNSALPFIMFSVAARNLDSSIVAILDGTIPMFEVIISIFFLKRSVEKNSVIGVLLGFVGIVVTSYGSINNSSITLAQIASIIAVLIATNSYAVASLYVNAKCKHIDSMAMACGSITFAAIPLIPSIFFADFSLIDAKVFGSLCGLGFLCTGIAYILYFKLIAEEGARTAVSTVLLIPVLGTIFGAIFLGEAVSLCKIIGCVTILASLKFILNLPVKKFLITKKLPM